MSNKKDISHIPLSTDVVDSSTGEILHLPFIRTAYDGSNVAASDASAIHFDADKEPSMTKQAFVDECDINTILRGFEKSGAITHYTDRTPRYGDFSNPVDYQTAMNLVIEAHDAFASLPARVREKFHNDPQEYLEFCSDEKNRDEMIALGIIDPPSPPEDTGGASGPSGGGDPQGAQNATGGASPPSGA